MSCSDSKHCTANSIFACQLNWLSTQFSLFTLNAEYFVCSSLPCIHCALWSAFGLLRKLHRSLILPHYHYCISIWPCPKHNTRIRSLSMLVPRKKWTVPQLTRVYGMVRVPRDLDCTLLVDRRSLLPRSKKVSTQNLLASRWWDNHSEMTVEHELETQKNQILMKEYDSRNCWSLVVQLCCSCRISLISHPLPLISLCFSFLLCVGWI